MANIFVRKSGSDSNNGLTSTTAKLTIAGALAVASNDDTIYVGAGEYGENPSSALSNISIIGDTKGLQTGDSGIIIINGASLFNSWSGINLEVHNLILKSAGGYALFCSNSSATFINCVMDGHYGISLAGSLINCSCEGIYLATNAGTPTLIKNTILMVSDNERAGQYTESNNYYPDYNTLTNLLFTDKVNNDYSITDNYISFVSKLGVAGADVPTLDMLGNTRSNPPWIGAIETHTSAQKFLIQDGTDLYKVVEGVRSWVGTTPLTAALFISDGMDDLTGVNNTHLSGLSAPKILLYDFII